MRILNFSSAKTKLCCTIVMVTLGSAGCGGRDVAGEVANQQAAEAQAAAERAQQIANFPALTRSTLLPQLRGLTERSVGDMESVANTLRVFQRARLALTAVSQAPATGELVRARDALRRELIRQQHLLYPAIRSTYAQYLQDQIDQTGARVGTSGARRRVLHLSSSGFTTELDATEAHGSIQIDATRFRFDRVVYMHPGGQSWEFRVNGQPDDSISY